MKKYKSGIFYILFLSIFFLVSSCKPRIYQSIKPKKEIYKKELNSINIDDLLNKLVIADMKLTPVLNYSQGGRQFYEYKKLPGISSLSLDEIKNWVNKGSDYFKDERENIQKLLNKINTLGINNKIIEIDIGALGIWIPSKNEILINSKAIKMGSKVFLDILRHESIHVAQSCYSGSKNNYPIRIGLPLEFSSEINFNLSHKLYSNNSKEGIFMEREAFSYSKVEGFATKLLNKFCFKKSI